MLSTDPYKGVRDFYPDDMFVQNYIFDKMRKTVESFGYSEYNASILEPTELYRSKTSEEIVNEQTYSFKDRGDRDVTLRPEMTPTVARLVAGRRRELAFPLRWYSIPNVFRYEQPQRGRLREHFQLNVDVFGSNSLEADVEIIKIAHQIMKNFGAGEKDFEIRINDRKSISKALLEKNLSKEEERKILRLLDKKGEAELNITESEDVKKILAALADNGIKNVIFSKSIARGFDYYTGMVFEVFDTNPENRRSLFGGGRYDNLTANFGGDPIPAVGFGMGDVTLRDFLESRNMVPPYESKTKLYIAIQDEKFRTIAEKLSTDLRNINIAVAIDISGKKVGDQIKLADKNKIPFVTVVGELEAKSGEFKIKELSTGTETTTNSPQEIFNLIHKV